MLITIGIPFHAETVAHFEQAIRSVFAQSHSNWELVLIGDNPRPDLLARAREIRDKRVRLIELSGGSLASSLNVIAREARGRLLFRMDADDIMHPARVQRQIDVLAGDPTLDLVCSDAIALDHDSSILGAIRPHPLPKTSEGFLYSTSIIHPSVAGRTEWFLRNPYDERYLRSQDKALWLATFSESRFSKLEEPLMLYRVQDKPSYRKYALTLRFERIALRDHGPGLVGRAGTSKLIVRSRLKQVAFAAACASHQKRRITNRRLQALSASEVEHVQIALSSVLAVPIPGWGHEQSLFPPDLPKVDERRTKAS